MATKRDLSNGPMSGRKPRDPVYSLYCCFGPPNDVTCDSMMDIHPLPCSRNIVSLLSPMNYSNLMVVILVRRSWLVASTGMAFYFELDCLQLFGHGVVDT